MSSYGSAERTPLAPSSSSSSSKFPGEQQEEARSSSVAIVGDGTTFKDQRDCLGTCSTNCARRLLAFMGVINGLGIVMVGVATGLGWVHECPECNDNCSGNVPVGCETSCCYCSITDLIIPIYTCFLGGILVIAELRLPRLDACCKNNFGFMFSLSFRVLYLMFIGSFGFAIKCQRYKYYVGWAAGIFSFGNAFLSCFVMNKHPGFIHLSGHETYAETADHAPFGGNKLAQKLDTPVATAQSVVESRGRGAADKNTSYAPPVHETQASAFGSMDPYAGSKVKATSSGSGQPNQNSGFDANPFA